MLYSLYLKKIALLDVFVLSSFYSFRILAGALISATPLSQWFLAFSLFFFLSLAMAKRYSELLHASDLVTAGNSGRGYRAGDRELLLSLGVGSSFSAVVILSLYVHSPEVRLLYSSPEFLVLALPDRSLLAEPNLAAGASRRTEGRPGHARHPGPCKLRGGLGFGDRDCRQHD